LMVEKVKSPIALEFDNIETMKRAIEIGEGISILPAPTVAREIASGTLVEVPLDQPLERPLGIIHRRDRNLCHIGQQFVQLLQAEGDFTTNKKTIPQPLNIESQTQGIVATSREA
jgi:DNA-binding transcriptional LysR family regulator